MNLYNMGKKILGYNITLKIGERVFAATTSNSFDITPNVKESQTKDDEGTKNKTVSGYEYSFGIDAVVELTEEGEKATRIGRDEAVEMTLLGEPIDFVYSVKGGKRFLPFTKAFPFWNGYVPHKTKPFSGVRERALFFHSRMRPPSQERVFSQGRWG